MKIALRVIGLLLLLMARASRRADSRCTTLATALLKSSCSLGEWSIFRRAR